MYNELNHLVHYVYIFHISSADFFFFSFSSTVTFTTLTSVLLEAIVMHPSASATPDLTDQLHLQTFGLNPAVWVDQPQEGGRSQTLLVGIWKKWYENRLVSGQVGIWKKWYQNCIALSERKSAELQWRDLGSSPLAAQQPNVNIVTTTHAGVTYQQHHQGAWCGH